MEVETQTHRLSDVMKREDVKQKGNISEPWEEIRHLGASTLVELTSGILFKRGNNQREQEPIHSLEYLVSALNLFEVSEPHDSIYALLAIANDSNHFGSIQKPVLAGAWHHSSTPIAYKVDYRQPILDTYVDFIRFSIHRSDPTKALDILCRPWAPTPQKALEITIQGEETRKQELMPSWIPQLGGAAFAMTTQPDGHAKLVRQNADPLVGLPDSGGQTNCNANYNANGSKKVDLTTLCFRKHNSIYLMCISGFVLDTVAKVSDQSHFGNIPGSWFTMGGWEDKSSDPPEKLWRTLVGNRGQ
jgi:hypothetical protein